MGLVRFGVSMEEVLLKHFDQAAEEAGFANRSEALRHLVRRFVHERQWENLKGSVVGAITIIYDHTTRNLTDRLLELEHSFRNFIISTTHVHFSKVTCLEVMLVRGEAEKVATFVRELQRIRGVKNCQFTCATPNGNEETEHG